LVPKKPKVHAVTMRRLRGTVPTASPRLKIPAALDSQLDRLPAFSGGSGNTAGAEVGVLPSAFVELLPLLTSECGIHSSKRV